MSALWTFLESMLHENEKPAEATGFLQGEIVVLRVWESLAGDRGPGFWDVGLFSSFPSSFVPKVTIPPQIQWTEYTSFLMDPFCVQAPVGMVLW